MKKIRRALNLVSKAALVSALAFSDIAYGQSTGSTGKELTVTVSSPIIQGLENTSLNKVKPTEVESDLEHAKHCGLVMRNGAEIYEVMHGYQYMEGFAISDGKIFYPKESSPHIMHPKYIRPIDDKQTITIRGFTQYAFVKTDGHEKPKVRLQLKIPGIFDPKVTLDYLEINHKVVPSSQITVSDNVNGYTITLDFDEILKEDSSNKNSLLSTLNLFNPLTESYNIPERTNNRFDITYELKIDLERYAPMDMSLFGDFQQMRSMLGYLSDAVKKSQDSFLDDIVLKLEENAKTPFNLVRSIFDFTRKSIKYEKTELLLTPKDAIKEGEGDCDDYANVMTGLLNSAGVPAIGYQADIWDFDIAGVHRFTQFALPLKDGSWKWFLSEPTWASESDEPYRYLQQKDRRYLLRFDFVAQPESKEDKIDSWVDYSCGRRFVPVAVGDIRNRTNTEIYLRSIEHNANSFFEQKAEELFRRNLTFRRQFDYASASKSNFYLAETHYSDHSMFAITLDHDDNVIISYKAVNGVLNAPSDFERIDGLKYTHFELLDDIGFDGANQALDFEVERNYRDELKSGSINLDSEIAQRYFPQIIERLSENGFLQPADRSRLMQFYNSIGGRNMFYVLEKAHQKKLESQDDEQRILEGISNK